MVNTTEKTGLKLSCSMKQEEQKKISITFWSFVNVLTNEIYLEYIQSFHKRYQNEYMYKSGLLSPWFKILGGMKPTTLITQILKVTNWKQKQK